MKKQQAISRATAAGISTDSLTQFANINVAKDVWWVDVPLDRLADEGPVHLHLLLFDDRYDELHSLEVPMDFLRQHLSRFSIREDRKCVSLELRAEAPDKFTNVKPIASNVRFDQFVRHTI